MPAEHGRQIMMLLCACERLRRSEAAVDFRSHAEVLGTGPTGGWAGKAAEGTRRADGVAKLNPLAFREVLLENEVLRHVPVRQSTREDQLTFDLVGVFLSQ